MLRECSKIEKDAIDVWKIVNRSPDRYIPRLTWLNLLAKKARLQKGINAAS
jgi:hypothetical protein